MTDQVVAVTLDYLLYTDPDVDRSQTGVYPMQAGLPPRTRNHDERANPKIIRIAQRLLARPNLRLQSGQLVDEEGLRAN